MQCTHVSENVWTGDQPASEDLTKLSQQGIRAIVNLREPSEDGDPTSSRDEGIKARELGMEYLNVPLPKQEIGTPQIDDLRTKLGMLPRPVFIHCESGARSGAVAIIDKAIQSGWTGEKTLQKAKSAGFPCDQPELSEFVRRYVDEHRQSKAGQ